MGYLFLMGALIVVGLLFPVAFLHFFTQPEFYLHAKFIHIVSVTLVFSNAVIGTLWETRSLYLGDVKIIRYTYSTVVWLDALLTAPMILLSVLTGILMGTTLGGVWTIGWLSIAFALFLFSGVVWLLFDIPSQYKIKRLFLTLPKEAESLPPELLTLLKFRLKLNLFTLVPFLFIFYLMVLKPELRSLASYLQ